LAEKPQRITLAALACIAIVIGGCTPGATGESPGGDESPSAPTGDLDEVSIVLNFVLDATYAPYLYGIEHGIFAEEGIELTIVPGEGSGFALQQLNEQQVDFAVSDMLVYMTDRIENGSATTAVMTHLDAPGMGLATVDAPLGDLSELSGKTVAAVPFSSTRYVLPVVLEQNGIDPNTVEIQLTEGATFQLLFEGDVDVAETFMAGSLGPATLLAEENGETLYWLDLQDYGLVGYSKTVITSDELIESNPDLVTRMVHALDRSIDESFAADDAEVIDLLLEHEPSLEREGMEIQWQQFKEVVDNPGPFDPEEVAGQLTYVLEGLDLTTDLSPEDFYTNDFVED
jgi:NitT/TauT family transport system substrate-binding protein